MPSLVRLRIAGFKSFAEPVTLDVLPGLTGIVGPNGCGKSNVVEALRWAMGETSARSLRGGEMDDVIFAGSAARPSRNLAEVTITLEGELPEPFSAEAELAVTRRIERGAGSGFRANGRELRARDVQTLYADLASGARSSGMVSQGRVSALVNAKPEERRQVLEEAAGITGLHARRHEAELKLRATEQNLARAEDLRVQLEATREGLRKQAKAAARYRNISGLIRAAEAQHLAILQGQAEAARTQAAGALAEAQEASAAAVRAVESAGLALAEAEAALPAPRAQEAACRTNVDRRRMEAENLAADAARAGAALAEADARAAELAADLAEAVQSRDAAEAVAARLNAEASSIEERLRTLPDAMTVAEAEASAATRAEAAAAAAADVATDAAAQASAMARQAEQTGLAAAVALASAQARLDQCRREHAAIAAQRVDPSALAEADRQAAQAREAAALARADFTEAEQTLLQANESASARHAAWQQAAAAHRSAAERSAEAQRRAEAASRAVAGLGAEMREAEAARVPDAAVAEAAAHAVQAGAGADAADQAVLGAEREARDAEAACLAARRAAADSAAAAERAQSRVDEAERTVANLTMELDEQRTRIEAAQQRRPDGSLLLEAEAAARRAEQRHAASRHALDECVQARAHAEHTLDQARAEAAAASAEAQRLAAEIAGLRAALSDAGPQTHARIIDTIDVPAGLEAAVAAALGEAAAASLDPRAPRRWAELPPLPETSPLPGTALSSCISFPAALARLLSQTALLAEDADGSAVQHRLLPGQAAVNRAGDVWRWDGQVSHDAAQTPEAARLEQRNRLRSRTGEAGAASAAAEAAQRRAAIAEQAAQAARPAEAEGRAEESEAALAARTAAATRDARAAEAADAEAQFQALLPGFARLQEARNAAGDSLQRHLSAVQAAVDPAIAEAARAAAEDRLSRASRALDAARHAQSQARDAALGAQDEARRIAAQAAAAAAWAALVAPQFARAQSESQAADAALQQAQLALGGLADPNALLAEARAAAEAAAAALARLQQSRSDRDAAEQAMAGAREQAALLSSRHQRLESALAAQATLLEQAGQQHAAAAAEREAALTHAASLPDLAKAVEAASAARSRLAEARQNSLRTAAAWQSLCAEAAQAEARHTALAGERADWLARLAESQRRADQLAQRHDAARLQCALLAAAPVEIAGRAAASSAALADAEQAHAAAAAALAAAEAQMRAAGAALRQADASEASSRAALARAEGTRDAAEGAFAAVQARIAERLGQDATLLPAAPADLSDAAEERARRRADRLTREREEMGPVNLRAETELAEIDDKARALERERDELTTAVAKLRGAIGHLNREGRSRLGAVFTEVDRHFRTLFTRMMGGGRAHLALTGSDDPLLAGLEIYAEPPGKKLATLSLLSGGEQALTALSLIFAVFRCTPAPISVLDEVDAPLDDANVERFCNLLDEIVRDTGTRFLVVTHHQVTMSRMDRLFGVTMQERGVSRLLSVDLQRATALVAEEALQAAE